MGIQWSLSPGDLARNLETVYLLKAREAVRRLLLHFAGVTEAYAKQHAPWTDRTSNARQSLFAVVDDLAGDVLALYLSHGMKYGKWLELANQGRYAIIMPTLEAHYPDIAAAMQELLR